jgi:hypothetical protein
MPTTHKLTAPFSTFASVDSIEAVRSEGVAGVWGEAGPLIARAVERQSDYTLGDVRALLDTADAQLWVARDKGVMIGAVVTKVYDFPQGRTVQVWLCGGSDFDSWGIAILVVIEGWAREIGASKVRIAGRKGWVRMLRDYEQTSVVLEKCL